MDYGWIGCDNGGCGIGSKEQLEILKMNDKVIDDDCDCDDNNNREIFLHCKHPELLLLKIGNLNQIPNTHLQIPNTHLQIPNTHPQT